MPADFEWSPEARAAAWDELDARSPEHLVFGDETAAAMLDAAVKAQPVVDAPQPCGNDLHPTVRACVLRSFCDATFEAAERRMVRINELEQVQPVVALPPCPQCDGGAVLSEYGEMGGPDSYEDCPACNGSGVERMVPVTALREWIEEERAIESAYQWQLDRLSAFLDGHAPDQDDPA